MLAPISRAPSPVGLFNDDNIPWLLNMLHNDIFDRVEKVTREQFFQVRGESRNKNAFWRSVSQIAVEKFNMQEVFNMKSSVRLTAIEKLGKARTSLPSLLNDPF